MVPPPSDKVSRVSSYSGSRSLLHRFHVRGFHPLRPAFPKPFRYPEARFLRSIPRWINPPVWALSFSLAATREIDVSFSSCGYLDVSVPRVPSVKLWIHLTVLRLFLSGFPHSDICGSVDICSSPQLFAAYHVLHRLPVPRHPPCALFCLTSFFDAFASGRFRCSVTYLRP